MDTINIINNLDQKIIIHNILITNQYKLIEMCKIFFEQKNIFNENTTINEVKEYIDEQKFINWEMFIDLINLDFKIYKPNTKIKLNTLEYLIETKSGKLINFLLSMDLNSKENTINWITENNNIFLLIFKNFHSDNNIINKTIDLIKKNNWEKIFEENFKIYSKTIISYAITKCSENVLIRMLDLNIIPIDWKDSYSNNIIHWACKRNFCKLFNHILENESDTDLIHKHNKGKRTPLHLACIKNNFDLTKLLEENNVKLNIDSNDKTHINYAVKYGDEKLVLYLLNIHMELDFNIYFDINQLFYQIIKYQNENVLNYFMKNNFINIKETNFIWTILLFSYKGNYLQMLSYGKKKIITSIIDYLCSPPIYYLNGKYIGDMFDNENVDDNKYL